MAHPDALCRSSPELRLILTPDLTIVDASDAYLRATLTRRDDIRGCRMFDVFPDNPHDAAADGVRNLRDSFDRVLQRREPHRMATQRYDVRDRLAGDGGWVEKSWAPVNAPVFGSGSQEVTHLLHQVEDVTQAVFLRRGFEEESLVITEQLATLDRLRQELVARQREARAAQASLEEMLRAGRVREPLMAALQAQLAMPETRPYWAPGQHAPMTAIYDVFHDPACPLAMRKVFLRSGQPFRRCPGCRGRVTLPPGVDGPMNAAARPR